MPGADPNAEKRAEVATALGAVVESAFPGDETLASIVRLWVGFEAAAGPGCAVCARSLTGLAVKAGSSRLLLVRGNHAGESAVCGACLEASREAHGDAPKDTPSWDMRQAQLARALALVSEEHAAIARECLSKRPQGTSEGRCILCNKAGVTARGRRGGVCASCTRDGLTVLQDLGTRAEIESDGAHCPQCGSGQVAAGVVHIEFTEMTCLSCGHSEICDVWQIADWR